MTTCVRRLSLSPLYQISPLLSSNLFLHYAPELSSEYSSFQDLTSAEIREMYPTDEEFDDFIHWFYQVSPLLYMAHSELTFRSAMIFLLVL